MIAHGEHTSLVIILLLLLPFIASRVGFDECIRSRDRQLIPKRCIVSNLADQCMNQTMTDMPFRDECYHIIHINMDRNFDFYNFSKLVDAAQRGNNNKRIILSSLNTTQNEADFNVSSFENTIDAVLLQRPWWRVSSSHHHHNKITIMLKRYPTMWQHYFDFIVATQFINESECNRVPMLIGRKNGISPGMMPILSIFSQMKLGSFPFAVFTPFWPLDAEWIAAFDCNQVNKWTCSFLPTTTCSIPNTIVQCQDVECLQTETKSVIWSVLSETASPNGTLILSSNESLSAKYGHKVPSHLLNVWTGVPTVPPFRYILPSDPAYRKVYKPYNAFSSVEAIFALSFLMRPNAFYRNKIHRVMHELHSRDENFSSTTPCVAAHIRRGDRIHYGINMTAWCNNATHDSMTQNVSLHYQCMYPSALTLSPCNFGHMEDLGCLNAPFGAITLQHIVDKIPILIEPVIYDVLILTDDVLWLKGEIQSMKALSPQWRFHYLHDPAIESYASLPKDRIVQEYTRISTCRFRENMYTSCGALFQASLQLVQQCSAFIGHYGSGVPSLLYSSMCIEHAGRYGTCPPQYDMRKGLHARFDNI